MRLAGSSNVVTASTIVDLPEPMSPVTRVLRPSARSVQTRSSNVPQLRTSRRASRQPLAIDIRLEDPADLVGLLGVLGRVQEAEPLHLADVLVDLVDEAGLVARGGQEDGGHLGGLGAGGHQP